MFDRPSHIQVKDLYNYRYRRQFTQDYYLEWRIFTGYQNFLFQPPEAVTDDMELGNCSIAIWTWSDIYPNFSFIAAGMNISLFDNQFFRELPISSRQLRLVYRLSSVFVSARHFAG